ncbi:hypothetical protein KC331_g1589 [Hortaea werneckii]|nr:hypothetical protein KC331_g1589 [Hortaea werneckii]KAI7721496.1 hypothetical protein KC353_g1296 [Hortaea werneckii]
MSSFDDVEATKTADMANMANVAGEINNEQLAISEGNALSARKATKKKDFQPFRFFDLPREIRDCIYELVLIPEFPIDFAPLVRGQSYESFWKKSTPCEETHGWHFDHYRKVKAALMLLRANKQINSEATPIYYGQPFRFSNQSGWLALYHWMEPIGRDKWDMIKDITICHPSFMSFPKYKRQIDDSYGGFALSLGMRPLYEDYDELRRDYLEGRSEINPFTYHEDGDCCGPEIDPVVMISDLPSLRHLRLILTCTRRDDLWWNVDLETPGTHPILDVETPAGLSIQAISLMPYYSYRPSRIIDNVAEEFGTITNYPPGSRLQQVVGFDYPVWPDEAIAIQQAYADMRDNNVELVGMYYDTHCHFPAFPNKECANKGLCNYLRGFRFDRYDRKSVDGVCCGTKDERQDHWLDFSV